MNKFDLDLPHPLMNAAGTLGFAPDPHGPVNLAHFGAFVTNPLSIEARTPANGQRYTGYPGNFLLHTGFPNPGFHTIVKAFAARWRRSTPGIIVHILVHGPDDTSEMAKRLESIEGLIGIELGIGSTADAVAVRTLTEAAAWVELPVIARLPFECARELAEAAVAGGAAAISLAPPRGLLPNTHGGMLRGRLYGPALFPQALAQTQAVAALDVPVIAAGGVYTDENVQAMLAAGAIGVQVDAMLWGVSFLSKYATGG
ncbi:MAG: nitronate monooxygenase [Chloroflexota bacterium]